MFYSGIGGQVDFLRGLRAPEWQTDHRHLFHCKERYDLADCAMLSPGAGVVTSRGLIRYVVTEYGVAYLHGKTYASGHSL